MWDLNSVSLGQEFVRGMRGDWRREAPGRQEQPAEQPARSSLIDRIRLTLAAGLIACGTWLKAHAAPAQANR
jgi:hypothetical protein